MSSAYVDSSCLVAIALHEHNAAALSRRLTSFGEIMASTLLEAELRSTLAREAKPLDEELLRRFSWILPERSLGAEIARVLDAGYVRGADCLHLASALYITADPATTTFLTLDSRQRAVAKALGFKT